MQGFSQQEEEQGGAPPPARKPPPEPSPQYATTTTRTEQGAFLFENIPHVLTASDDGESERSFSLPNIPSPMPQPSPSMLGGRHHTDMMTSPTPGVQRPSGYLSGAKRSGSRSAAHIRSGNDEDTFCDDRSLEQRIQRTLGTAPKTPMDVQATPTSIPVTPAGHRAMVFTNSRATTPWDRPTPASSSNNHHLVEPVELDQSLLSHRSALALVKLKQDLRNAMSNSYLLQQEKEAAESKAEELARQNELLLHEKKEVDGRAAAVAEERAAMEEARAQVNKELETFKEELLVITDERDQMMSEIQQLRSDKETSESEYQELSQRTRALIREHQEDLKSFGENTDTRVSRLKAELEASRGEVETLKNSLAQAEENFATSTQELKNEREKAHAELVAMTEKHDSCLGNVERLEAVIQEARQKSNEHIQNLETQQQKMKTKAEADQLEIMRLKEALKKSGSREHDLLALQPDAGTPSQDMEAVFAALQEANQRLARQQVEIVSSQEKLGRQQLDIDSLEAELEQVKTPGTTTTTSSNKNRVPRTVACQTDGESQGSSLAVHNHRRGPASATTSDPITERLFRIRDAAERAGLVKEHHRELARIREQHKSEMRELAVKHEEAKERALKDAKTKLDSLHGNATEQLKSELEEQIAELGRKHNVQVERLNDEMQRKSAAAEESLKVAMSKLSSTKTKLAQEIARREKLEDDLISMEKQSAFEKQRLIRDQDAKIEALKKMWDEEKRVLLDVIQRECNKVFEQNKGSAMGCDSPRGVAIDFAADADSPKSKQKVDNEASNNNMPISPSYSDIDKELRETEALVKSLMGKSINVTC